MSRGSSNVTICTNFMYVYSRFVSQFVAVSNLSSRANENKQSEDLKLAKGPHLTALRELLYGPEFKSMMTEITGIQFNKTVDLSASRYPPKGYLACHDDDIADDVDEGRRIAFIIYLVDSDWSEDDGGWLDLFSRDEDDDPTQVTTRLLPGRNKFAFFETTATSYHQVSEVVGKRERLSITGWYHGKYDNSSTHNANGTRKKSKVFRLEKYDISLEKMDELADTGCQSAAYQSEKARDAIGDVLIKKSFVELHKFLPQSLYDGCLQFLKQTEGKAMGPPNQRRYTRIPCSPSATGNVLEKLSYRFLHGAGLLFVQDVTNFEFVQATLEWRMFQHGDYTLLHDDDVTNQEGDVDVILSFSPGDWRESGGQHVYVAEEEHIASLIPGENVLSIVFREGNMMKFVKMVNHVAPGPRWELCVTYSLDRVSEGGSS